MDYPKISIVTPSFNQAQFLEQTIRSVLDQRYQNLEYVIMDGGSTDGSVEIIKKYASDLAYWVSEPDAGQYEAINKGFSHTTGEIMGWINSSDIYYPWTFSVLAEVFSEMPHVRWLTGIGTHLAHGNAPRNFSSNARNVYDFLAGDYAWLQQESIFWRRELWEECGGALRTDLKFAADFELWLTYYRKTHLFNVGTILAGFRYHDDRRGSAVPYRKEAIGVYKLFHDSFALRHRLRAWLIHCTPGRGGRLVRSLLRRCGLLPWYYSPRILYDYDTKRWRQS